MMAWEHFDQAGRLKTGTWSRVHASVLEVTLRGSGHTGGIAMLRWTDATGQARDGSAFVSAEDLQTRRYEAGGSVQAWHHPGFFRLELSEVKPDIAPSQSFTGIAAIACLVLGLGLLGFAGATGRLLAP